MIKWIVGLALITAILGILGALILIFATGREDGLAAKSTEKTETPAPPSAKKIETDTILKADTIGPTTIADTNQLKQYDESKHADTTSAVVLPPVAMKKTESKKEETAKKEEIIPEEEIQKKEKKKENPQKKEILLNKLELRRLAARIKAYKIKHHLVLNCVQLNVTSEGNKRKTMRQVETYLKSKKFTIAGREVVDEKIKGIKVKPNGGCIKILIGSF